MEFNISIAGFKGREAPSIIIIPAFSEIAFVGAE
jgi:hypothetical protein